MNEFDGPFRGEDAPHRHRGGASDTACSLKRGHVKVVKGRTEVQLIQPQVIGMKS